MAKVSLGFQSATCQGLQEQGRKELWLPHGWAGANMPKRPLCAAWRMVTLPCAARSSQSRRASQCDSPPPPGPPPFPNGIPALLTWDSLLSHLAIPVTRESGHQSGLPGLLLLSDAIV